ncbi:SRPBCC domain-containing protein [Brachybacterium sacelli]|uniref:SRPBCC domain-containing protein n=1 Tax=Brachybacterium sacelli TaxID=173364 RepID=UPI003622BEA0
MYLPAPPDEVWPFLVNHGEFARWYAFGGAQIEPIPDGRVELRWDEHGIFHGQVREVIPDERFSFLLALEPDVEPMQSNATLVSFKLRSYGEDGALLTIRQSGYEQLDENLGSPRELADQDRESWEAGLDLLVDCVTSPGRTES